MRFKGGARLNDNQPDLSMSEPMQNPEAELDLAALLAEHVDCDYTKRVPSGLESLDPAGIERVIREADKPVVLKFGKDFCGWTKKLNRSLQVLVPKYKSKADFYEVNIPSYEHLRETWKLDTSPIMVLIKDGQEVDRTDAAEPHEVPPVFEKWFGPPEETAAQEGE